MGATVEYAILDLESQRILPHRWVSKIKAKEMLEKALDPERFTLLEQKSNWVKVDN